MPIQDLLGQSHQQPRLIARVVLVDQDVAATQHVPGGLDSRCDVFDPLPAGADSLRSSPNKSASNNRIRRRY